MAQCALRGNSTNLQSRIGNQMYFLIIVNLNFEQILESTPLKWRKYINIWSFLIKASTY